jgi:hypothetical protein
MDKKELVARLTKIADMFEDNIEESFEQADAPVIEVPVELPTENQFMPDEEAFLFASKLTKLASEILSSDKVADMPMQTFELDESNITHNIETAKVALMNALRTNKKDLVFQKFLACQEGTSNKFHYFGIFKKADGTFVGGNSWGRISGPGKLYPQKSIEVASGDEHSVRRAIESKISAKKNGRGYREV